jgi:hypothetical protein
MDNIVIVWVLLAIMFVIGLHFSIVWLDEYLHTKDKRR